MARSPLENVQIKWQQRNSELAAQGIDPKQFSQIQQQDINRVKQGGTAMSNVEARVMVQSVLSGGRAPFVQPKRPTGILGTIENIAPDVGDIVTGLWKIPGSIYKDLQRIGTDPGIVAKPFTMHGDLGARLRQAAQTPAIDLIPGLHDVAGLTTSEGRKELQRHPVGTVVDVVPLAKGVSEAAGGALAKGAEEGSLAGTATEALQEGKPLKAGFRAVTNRNPLLNDRINQFMRATGIHADDYAAIRAFTVQGRKAVRDSIRVRDEKLKPMFQDMSPEEVQQLTREAQNYRPGMDISPQHEAIIGMARNIQQDLVDASEGRLVRVAHNGREYIYPVNGDVGKAHLKKVAAEEEVSAAHQNLEDTVNRRVQQMRQEGERLAGRRNRLLKTVDRLEREYEQRKARVQNTAGKGEGKAYRTATQKARDTELTLQSKRMQLRTIEARMQRAGEFEERQAEFFGPEESQTVRDPQIKAAKDRLTAAQKASEKAQNKLDEQLAVNAPGAFDALVEQERMKGAVKYLNSRGNFKLGITEALKRLERHDPTGVMSPEQWAKIGDEATRSWQRYAAEGYDPLWVENVEEHGLASAVKPHVLPTNAVRQVSHIMSDFRPGVSDLAVAISLQLMRQIEYDRSVEFINTHLVNYMKSQADVTAELHQLVDLREAAGKLKTGDTANELQMLRDQRYVEFDPEHFGVSRAKSGSELALGDKVYIPRDVVKALDDLRADVRDRTVAKRTLSTSTHVYKTAIMGFSLKHLAHILLGGTVFVLGRGGITELNPTTWVNAYRELAGGRVPEELLHVNDSGLSPHDLIEFHAGGTLGRIMKTVWEHTGGWSTERLAKFEETVTNMQRAVAYMSEEKRALRSGMTEAAAREVGLQHAYKTLVDMDGMSTIERNVIKRVMPFYGYTRHIMRYALTYPIDYPLRASIVTHLAEQEINDRSSGLPRSFESLFFMGTPDASGNINAVDVRPTNPFRDLGNDLTFAGFIRQLNPAIAGVFQAAGVNIFTGSPDLYPELTVDPQTGALVAKRPPNGWFTYAKTFVPEISTVDDLFQVSAQTRQMYAANPNALRSRLYADLFIPFGVRTVNLPQAETKEQINYMKVAQAAVSKAMKGQGSVANLPVVPYNGQLVPGAALQALINNTKTPPGVAPRAITITKRRRNTGGF